VRFQGDGFDALDVVVGDPKITRDLTELEGIGLDLALVAGQPVGVWTRAQLRRRLSTTWRRSP
jgi:hypothetical protein